MNNSVSAGAGSDAKAFGAAALLTFTCGMIALIGYMMIGGLGIVLGIIGIVFGLVWWKGHHERMLPRDLPTKSLVLLGITGLALFGLAAAMA